MNNIKEILKIAYSIATVLEEKIVKKENTLKRQNYLTSDYAQFAVFANEDSEFLLVEDYFSSYLKKDEKEYYKEMSIVLRPFRRWQATYKGKFEVNCESKVPKVYYTVRGVEPLISIENPQLIKEADVLEDIKNYKNILEFIKNTKIE
jgi:hypothetical protein